MTYKLAKWQIMLAIAAFILAIVAYIAYPHENHWFHYGFHNGSDVIGLIGLIIGIAMLVIGIIQIFEGVKENNMLGLAAGITGVLAFIPFVAIAALILNIIILVAKK